MDGDTKVHLYSLYYNSARDADGLAAVYYVLRDFCGERVSKYYYGDNCVWTKLGGIYGGSNKRWDTIGRQWTDGGGVGTWTVAMDDFL